MEMEKLLKGVNAHVKPKSKTQLLKNTTECEKNLKI